MSAHSGSEGVPADWVAAGRTTRAASTTTAWTGWVVFAAVMMIILGAFNAVDGLVALFRRTWFVATGNTLLTWNFTTWGWLWLITGVIMVAAGFAVLAGETWGRVVGVIVAALNAIGQLAFASAYPVWSILIIVLDVVVIYALIVHGRALAAD